MLTITEIHFFLKFFVEDNKRKSKSAQKSKKKKATNLPPAPFHLSQNDMKIADTRAKNIHVPSAYGWKPRCFFLKKTYTKSHDWKQVGMPTRGLYSVCKLLVTKVLSCKVCKC